MTSAEPSEWYSYMHESMDYWVVANSHGEIARTWTKYVADTIIADHNFWLEHHGKIEGSRDVSPPGSMTPENEVPDASQVYP